MKCIYCNKDLKVAFSAMIPSSKDWYYGACIHCGKVMKIKKS